ncbi:hypothetical protein QVD17_37520 [Tagetes erecta]|uniref:TTF-type domain-containing protein n=1 Tax=Tagetes erecta TaxID=13708 RepID=A0AAD8JUR6_TARER|nr:hypothetical protein QVD17_37520 [Tagetes erecta]
MKRQPKQVLIGNFFKRKFQEGENVDVSQSGSNLDTNPGVNSDVSPTIADIDNDETPDNDNVGQCSSNLGPSMSSTSFHSRSTKIDLNDLPSDPVDRPPIDSYHPNQIDEIRRAYLVKGPFQPISHNFESKEVYGKNRRFVKDWLVEFPWMEYSTKADKAYCLPCYLFKQNVGNQGGGGTWSTKGFCDWTKKGAIREHVGGVRSLHYKAVQKCDDLMKPKQSIHEAFNKLSKEEMVANRARLSGSVQSVRFCLENTCPFRAHDESENSRSPGMFLAVLKLISANNPDVGKYTLGNAKKNNKLTSPTTQKEIIECFAKEVTKIICEEIKGDVFGLLVDESSDVSLKEQMAVVVRYVDKLGVVKESFIGIVHVTNTNSSTLKEAILSLLANNQLSIDQVRGQGYDGASNMRGKFNGLKSLILRDNPSAHYIHCFAHQLQLVIVAVAKKHEGVKTFYEYLSMVVNTVSASCKRKDMLREAKKERVEKEILKGELKTGKGLNQEVSLARAGDTRWGSHHRTIISLLKLFPEVVTVLRYVKEDGDCSQKRSNAKGILSYFQEFECVFYLHLMDKVLGLTNILSKHLQQKSQDLLEAAKLINGTKSALNDLRQNGFELMLEKVKSFCEMNDIRVLDMMESYGNPRNRKNVLTNRHHFEVDIFNEVLDMQIQEFGNRFNEVSTNLLENMSGLNPCDRFANFDISKIVAFSELYKDDFTIRERGCIEGELNVFYHTLREDDRFANLNGLCDLARLMVETGKHRSFPLAYRILKLALVLPVATATVERCFSKLKLVKTDLRNRMGDDFLNGALVCTVEKEIFDKVTDEDVMIRFQAMKERRGQIF